MPMEDKPRVEALAEMTWMHEKLVMDGQLMTLLEDRMSV